MEEVSSMGRKIVQIEVDDELVSEYFEGLDEVNDSDARTAVQEIFDAGLEVEISPDYGSDTYRRVTSPRLLEGDTTQSPPRTVGNDSGASGSRGLE
jgi:hypothetical protein